MKQGEGFGVDAMVEGTEEGSNGTLGKCRNEYSRGSVTNYAEFCSEKDMDGGQSPELAGKARLSGGGVIGWRILVTQVIGWRSILIG